MRAPSTAEAPRQHSISATNGTNGTNGTEHAVRGGVRFVLGQDRAALQAPIEAASLLCVDVELPIGGRGHLRESIQSAIETALAGKKASPPPPHETGDLEATISHQLRRAREMGMRGLCLHIRELGRLALPSGVLDLDDSAILRWWLRAACEKPILVLLDDADRAIGAYGPPARIERWAGTAMQCLEDNTAADAPVSSANRSSPQADAEPATTFCNPRADTAHDTAPRNPRADTAHDAAHPRTPRADTAHDTAPRTTRTDSEDPTSGQSGGERTGAHGTGYAAIHTTRRNGEVSEAAGLSQPQPWKAWAEELDAARGPKPLATIERLFMTNYVPLAQAVGRGEADAAARATLSSWGASFARSYVEAFGALRITGKRPLMVLDVPQLASRVARLHGAKVTQLILVDGMRFDLGLRVHERLRTELGAIGRCTERFLLWAALPTTTASQLELLARGPEALVHRDLVGDRDEAAFGGRGASILRRVRVGGRDLLKLDLVEARLRESGPAEHERLDALATDVASVIAAHAKSLAPRTLLLLFGDHGFQLERTGLGTGIGTSGGASPDEVLVPAFTWLMGDVH